LNNPWSIFLVGCDNKLSNSCYTQSKLCADIQCYAKVWEPLAESVKNFNKIREFVQNACYFLFSIVLSKIFYIKDVYI